MPKVFVTDRQIVVPGDPIAEVSDDLQVVGPYVFEAGGIYYSSVMGLASISEDKGRIEIIPLEGPYVPKKDDIVIGLVTDIGLTYWEVDINSPYKAVLNANDALNKQFSPMHDDLRRYLTVGDYIVAKVIAFDRTRDPLLTIKGKGLGRVTKGKVIEVKPSRVPRIIGKRGSMISMLLGETGCNITVGQNGRVWVACQSAELEDVLVMAIRKIEREAHTRGLTDKVREFIIEERRRRGL